MKRIDTIKLYFNAIKIAVLMGFLDLTKIEEKKFIKRYIKENGKEKRNKKKS